MSKLVKFFTVNSTALASLFAALAVALAGAFAFSGTARTAALVTAIVPAIIGFLKLALPKLSIGGTAVADSEQFARDIITAFAAHNPAAFATILADASKLAGDFVMVPAAAVVPTTADKLAAIKNETPNVLPKTSGL